MIYNFDNNEQRFYLGHDDDVMALARHPTSDVVRNICDDGKLLCVMLVVHRGARYSCAYRWHRVKQADPHGLLAMMLLSRNLHLSRLLLLAKLAKVLTRKV